MQKFLVQNEKYVGAFMSLPDKDKGWCWTICQKARASYPTKKKKILMKISMRGPSKSFLPERNFIAR